MKRPVLLCLPLLLLYLLLAWFRPLTASADDVATLFNSCSEKYREVFVFRDEKRISDSPTLSFGNEEDVATYKRLLGDARSCFQKILSKHPGSPYEVQALYRLGHLSDIGVGNRFQKAVEYYKRCATEHSDDPLAQRCKERHNALKKVMGGHYVQ